MSNKNKVAAKMERKDTRKYLKILGSVASQHKDPDDAEAHAERVFDSHKRTEDGARAFARKSKSLAGKFKAGLAKRAKEEPARIAALDKMFGVKR